MGVAMLIITRKISCVVICVFILISITACSQQTMSDEGIYTPGTYTSTKEGFGGNVKVAITVDTEKILSVKIDGTSETNGIGTVAIEKLSEEIRNLNSYDVDIVAGATSSSNAIIKAAKECIAQAKGENISYFEEAETKEEILTEEQIEKELMKKVGASITAKEVQYNMSANLDKTFLLYGTAELSDYYNWRFDDLEPDYFCIEVQPAVGKYTDRWYIYCHRDSFKELYDELLDGNVSGVVIGAEIPNFLYDKNQGNMAKANSISWF
jgi:uncharacterized protein with FMN-binding domain